VGTQIGYGENTMGIVDKLSIGKVMEDFGVIEESDYGFGTKKVSILIVEKDGRLKFFIQTQFGGIDVG